MMMWTDRWGPLVREKKGGKEWYRFGIGNGPWAASGTGPDMLPEAIFLFSFLFFFFFFCFLISFISFAFVIQIDSN
jgi:hypothetical protein